MEDLVCIVPQRQTKAKHNPPGIFLQAEVGILGRFCLKSLNHCTVLAFLYINEDSQKLPPYVKIEVLGEGLES